MKLKLHIVGWPVIIPGSLPRMHVSVECGHDTDIGMEFDTMPMNKKTIRYDFDISYIETFAWYLHKKHGDARGCREKHVRYDIWKVRYLDISKVR